MVHKQPRHNVRIGLNSALPVKIVRVTVEKMIQRITHISQPHHYYYGYQTDMYCVGVDDNDDGLVLIATTCVLLILILYVFLVLLRKYEKENDKY
jgi:hypothetical protein